MAMALQAGCCCFDTVIEETLSDEQGSEEGGSTVVLPTLDYQYQKSA